MHGRELWRSGAGSTELVKDVREGSGGAFVRELTDFGGHLAFVADDGSGAGLWFADETSAWKVRENVGVHLASLGGSVMFPSADPLHGEELWRTDGGWRIC